MDLVDLSDIESAEVAMGFYTNVLKKPGTTEQIVKMSRFARAFPNTIDRATTNLLKERKRRIKAEEKLAVLGSRVSRLEEDLRYEKSQASDNIIVDLRRRLELEELFKSNPEEVAKEMRILQRNNERLVTRVANYERKVISLQQQLAGSLLSQAPLKSRQVEVDMLPSAHAETAAARAAKRREKGGGERIQKKRVGNVSCEAKVGSTKESSSGSAFSEATDTSTSSSSSSAPSRSDTSTTAVRGSPPRC